MELSNSVWELAFILALAIFVASLVLVYVLHKRPLRNSILRPFPIVIIATFLSVLILFFPAYLTRLGTDSAGIIESLLISIQASIKVFKIDNPYEVFFSPLKLIDSWVKEPYLLFAIVLSMFAPLLLISFVLSFVKGIKAYASYLLGYRREVYIFSKLNEKSLVLAKSVLAHYIGQQGGGVNRRKASDANAASQDHGISQEAASGKKKKGLPLIIFTDVVVESKKPVDKLYQSACDMKCICFKQDILSVRFDLHSKKAKMNFVLIGDDRIENNGQALRLLGSPYASKRTDALKPLHDKPGAKEKPDYSKRNPAITTLYVFDATKESELLLDGKQGSMTIRRINRVRQFVHYFLWDYLWDKETGAHTLFDTAVEVDGKKHITVLLVGLGKTGIALLKSLAWFCQMDGYELKIHALDTNPRVAKRLGFECPELLAEQHNHNFDPDEAVYSISVHPGIDAYSEDFAELVSSLAADATFAFVSLGDDEVNVETAVNLRILFKRAGHKQVDKPVIYSVVHDSERVSKLKNLANYSDDDYGIHLIGDNLDLFSYQMVFDPRLENLAAQAHIQWTLSEEENRNLAHVAEKAARREKLTEEEKQVGERAQVLRAGYWGKEYYRHSSIARVIHEKVVNKYGPSSSDDIAKLESRRWNAYMRSEGFVYNDERNNLAKQHHLLIPYSKKPREEQAKDYRGFKREPESTD